MAAFYRVLFIDLSTLALSLGAASLGSLSRSMLLVAVGLTVFGFAIGARAGCIIAPASNDQATIIVCSILGWLVALFLVMFYSLNTFGS